MGNSERARGLGKRERVSVDWDYWKLFTKPFTTAVYQRVPAGGRKLLKEFDRPG